MNSLLDGYKIAWKRYIWLYIPVVFFPPYILAIPVIVLVLEKLIIDRALEEINKKD